MKGKTTTYENDVELWKAFKKGSESAYVYLFKYYYNDLYFYGLKLVGNDDIVKDELQELFADLWQKRQRLGDINYIKSYLIKSFRRRLLKRNEKSGKTIKKLNNYKHLKNNFQISVEELIISEENAVEKRTNLQKAFQILNKTQKEIIYLKYYNDLDYKEIAEIIGLKYQSIRNSMHNAIKSLRDNMNEENEN